MKSYLAQRLAVALLTLLGMSIVIFVLLRMAPGNIVDVLFATAGLVDPRGRRRPSSRSSGWTAPHWVQYLDWLRGILSGDLGKSYRYELPAWQLIRPLLPVTLELAGLSIAISVLLGVPTGVISALRQDSPLDYVLRLLSLAGLSMPSFWLAMVIILTLVAWFDWIPPMTYVSPSQNLRLHTLQFLLPALAVGLSLVGPDHADHPLGAPRGPPRGLHPHRAGQGSATRRGRLAARPQERDAARGHGHRHRVRVHDRRAGGHRVGVQPCRAWPGSSCRRSSGATTRWCRTW